MTRILVENGTYALRNMGDIAMLQTAVSRIREFSPGAEIHVVTSNPCRLERYLPGCVPLDPRQRSVWMTYQIIPFQSRVPKRCREWLLKFEMSIRKSLPKLSTFLMQTMSFLRGTGRKVNFSFARFVESCDLVVVSGGGFFNDSFINHSEGILDTLEVATSVGTSIVMVGQGIGPLTTLHTLDRMSSIFPHILRIGIREPEATLDLLTEAGVSPDKIVCTGDDAIELAYSSASCQRGVDIGFNLRMTSYSGVSAVNSEPILKALREFVQQHHIRLRCVPISFEACSSDTASIELALTSDQTEASMCDDTPEAVIQEVSCCRLVVTGSYHAAVFALAQGIPVIAIVGSLYYQGKFDGLRNKFGDACAIVRLQEYGSNERFEHLLSSTYLAPERHREHLLNAAKTQVVSGRAFYANVLSLVSE